MCIAHCTFDAAKKKVVHMTTIAKAHLEFRGMCIHIDLRRIDLHEQYIGGMSTIEHDVPKTNANRACDQAITQRSTVQIKVLQIRLCARERWLTQPTRQPAARRLVLDVQRVRHELIAHDLRNSTLTIH